MAYSLQCTSLWFDDLGRSSNHNRCFASIQVLCQFQMIVFDICIKNIYNWNSEMPWMPSEGQMGHNHVGVILICELYGSLHNQQKHPEVLKIFKKRKTLWLSGFF